MSRVTVSFVVVGVILCTPPIVRAGSLLTYDITATIQDDSYGGAFDGQTLLAFFTYDTLGDSLSQSSPAGVIAPSAVAFTDANAQISLITSATSFLQVHAAGTYANSSSYLPSYGSSPLEGAFFFTGSFTPGFTPALTDTLPPFSLISVGFISGPLSVTSITFTNVTAAVRTSVPEPATLLLLASGGLASAGVRRWRKRRTLPTQPSA